MRVYLRAKFEVCSIILTSFRQGERGNFIPLPQKKPLKSPPRLGLNPGCLKCILGINLSFANKILFTI